MCSSPVVGVSGTLLMKPFFTKVSTRCDLPVHPSPVTTTFKSLQTDDILLKLVENSEFRKYLTVTDYYIIHGHTFLPRAHAQGIKHSVCPSVVVVVVVVVVVAPDLAF